MFELSDMSDITDDDDSLEMLSPRTRARKTIRERVNHFEKWEDREFLDRFRLSKDAVRIILEEIRPAISSRTTRNNAVSPEVKLLLTLRYFATGSFLSVCGDFCGIHKSTASVIVRKVSRAIASLHSKYIKFPEGEEIKETQHEFYAIAKFPRCIGALDCTHIKILSPGGNDAEIFRNRKGFFSINVQTIADTRLKIRNIVARWPGSSHDSNIFRNSAIRGKFESRVMGNALIVADSGYAVGPYIITKLNSPRTRGEQLFNESLIRTRIVVERSYGVWKRRFPILSKGINLNLDRIEAVVVATAVLHNIACDLNIDVPSYNDDEIEPQDDEAPLENPRHANDSTRRSIIRYFDRL